MNSAFYDFVSELERIHNKKQNCGYVSTEEILLTSANLILINVFQELRFWINPKGRKLHYIHCTKNEVFHKGLLQ